MKILYTIGALVAIIIIAAGAMSLSGDKTITDILIPQQEETTQDEYVDNTGDVVGGLPEDVVVSENHNRSLYEDNIHAFQFYFPASWEIEFSVTSPPFQYPFSFVNEETGRGIKVDVMSKEIIEGNVMSKEYSKSNIKEQIISNNNAWTIREANNPTRVLAHTSLDSGGELVLSLYWNNFYNSYDTYDYAMQTLLEIVETVSVNASSYDYESQGPILRTQ